MSYLDLCFLFEVWLRETHKSIDLANLWFAPLTRNRDALGVSFGANTFYSWCWSFMKALPLMFHCLLWFWPSMSKFRSPNKYMQVENRRMEKRIRVRTWDASCLVSFIVSLHYDVNRFAIWLGFYCKHPLWCQLNILLIILRASPPAWWEKRNTD